MNRQIVDCPHVRLWRAPSCLPVSCSVGCRLTGSADGPHVELKLALEDDALRMGRSRIVFLDHIITFPASLDRIDPIEGPNSLMRSSPGRRGPAGEGRRHRRHPGGRLADDQRSRHRSSSSLSANGHAGHTQVRFMVTWSLKSAPRRSSSNGWPTLRTWRSIRTTRLRADHRRGRSRGDPRGDLLHRRFPGLALAQRFHLHRGAARELTDPGDAPWSIPLLSLGILVVFMVLGLQPRLDEACLVAVRTHLPRARRDLLLARGGVAVVDFRPASRTALERPTRTRRALRAASSNIYRPSTT